MKRVAVLGGGPAGASAAERLAEGGLRTILFDEKLAWEKPCGGGLTYKAYNRYPYLIDNSIPKRVVTCTRLAAPGAAEANVELPKPLVIYSRYDLNGMLLARAARAGAELEQARVTALRRVAHGWEITAGRGKLNVDFCIVATGARNSLRGVGAQLTAEDTMLALGYYLPQEQEHVDIQFLPGLEGYIWIFPRNGHLSAGICGKGEPARKLRARLELFLRERGIAWSEDSFFSHILPSLAQPAWRRNRLSGDGWLAVGDAGGLVDPVTGEGLYYAIRSGDLAGQVLLSDAHPPEHKPQAYRALVDRDFALNLEAGAAMARRLFLGRFLWAGAPQRMLQLMRRSPKLREVVQDLIAGTQGYLGLKRRLLRSLDGGVLEATIGLLLSRFVPKESA